MSWITRNITALFLILPMAGCADIPDVDHEITPAAASTPAPQLESAVGPLSARDSKAILANITKEAGDSGMLQRHLAIEAAVSGSPLMTGNRTTLLRDGPQSFRAIFQAIAQATNYINLEYYMIEDIKVDGETLSDLLIARRKAGVAVNILYDSFGSSSTPKAFFDRLKKAGIVLVEFNPIDPLAAKAGYALNDRDHRKILIIDGRIAVIGGVNLSTSYQSMTFGKSAPAEGPAPEHWRDADLRIEGPAVAELQRLFARHW
ncbi:MAG TPA: phospholipase D-like domain-containing protein, partial [Dongiaceae bacterium]